MHVPRLALTATLFALALTVPLTAAADTYDYSYMETAVHTAMFTYDSPVLITADTVFTPLTCSSTIPADSGGCTTVEIDPTGLGTVIMNFVGGGNVETSSLPASFFAPGDNSLGLFTMDITDVPDTATTPEPSSFLLLGTGLLGMCGVLRRRLV